MFVDEAIVELKAGDGGDGCLAFRREKYIAMGGPYGGNGGRGANIIFKADSGLNTLVDFRYNKLIKGKHGGNGLGKGMHGKAAEDVVLKVPMGTTITNLDTGEIIADLVNNGDEVIAAKGGRGGRGNMAFATQSNPAPKYAENGEPGEELKVKLELKLLAGKSTIISKISASKPKIADYPFTTLRPNLGVVRVGDGRSFVVADLPGLIKGASEGTGLGDKFLKHIERTRVIAHVIDMSGYANDPYEDYNVINEELNKFDENLLKKPQIIIANKMDTEKAKENLEKFKQKVNKEIFEISAIKNEGLDKVIYKLADLLDTIPKTNLYDTKKFSSHKVYKFKEEKPYQITKENDTFVITGDEIIKLFKMSRLDTDEAILRFSNKLKKLGVDDELREMGAKEGDTVKILDFEFEFKE